MTTREILMVCYGNICRSPMAEVLLQAALDERLGPGHGWLVTSAGTHAYDGYPASEQGRLAMARRGLDLSRHSSRQLTRDLLRRADRIVCMTREHREWVLSMDPGAKRKTATLGEDVEDPIGGREKDYERVAAVLERRLGSFLDELVGVTR